MGFFNKFFKREQPEPQKPAVETKIRVDLNSDRDLELIGKEIARMNVWQLKDLSKSIDKYVNSGGTKGYDELTGKFARHSYYGMMHQGFQDRHESKAQGNMDEITFATHIQYFLKEAEIEHGTRNVVDYNLKPETQAELAEVRQEVAKLGRNQVLEIKNRMTDLAELAQNDGATARIDNRKAGIDATARLQEVLPKHIDSPLNTHVMHKMLNPGDTPDIRDRANFLVGAVDVMSDEIKSRDVAKASEVKPVRVVNEAGYKAAVAIRDGQSDARMKELFADKMGIQYGHTGSLQYSVGLSAYIESGGDIAKAKDAVMESVLKDGKISTNEKTVMKPTDIAGAEAMLAARGGAEGRGARVS